MPIVARDSGSNFLPAPEGLHQAVCVDVVDLGLVETQWGSKPKASIVWQIEDVNPETQKRFAASKWYTLSLSEKANLRRDLEAWRGRKFTKDELAGFDLEKLIGVNCQIQVVHNIVDGGKTYANVQAVVPLGKGMEKIVPLEYVRRQDRHENEETAPEDDDVPF